MVSTSAFFLLLSAALSATAATTGAQQDNRLPASGRYHIRNRSQAHNRLVGLSEREDQNSTFGEIVSLPRGDNEMADFNIERRSENRYVLRAHEGATEDIGGRIYTVVSTDETNDKEWIIRRADNSNRFFTIEGDNGMGWVLPNDVDYSQVEFERMTHNPDNKVEQFEFMHLD